MSNDTRSFTSCQEAALHYARLGYAVLPLQPGEKSPHFGLTRHGLKNATTDPDTIRAWWQQAPDAGVGVLPPPTVLVIDFDDREIWERWREQWPDLEKAPRQRTPRGMHVWLKFPEHLGKALPARPKIEEGVDLRGLGRSYLVAAPTRRRDGSYVWERDLVPPEQLPPCPQALERMLVLKLAPLPPSPPQPAAGARESRVRGLIEWAARRIAGAPKGSRHNTALAMSRYIGGLLHHARELEAEARERLVDAALASGLPRKEAERTVEDGFKYGDEAPLDLPPAAPVPSKKANPDPEPWSTPLPISALHAEQLPAPPRGLLPPEMEEYLYALSEQLRLRPLPAVMSCLTTLGALMAWRGVWVCPDEGAPQWGEPPVLWAVLIGPPGSGKTPVLTNTTRPAWQLEKELQRENEKKIAEFEERLNWWKHLPKKQRAEETPPKPPVLKRLLTADATPEKLADLLATNRAIFVSLDEIRLLLLRWTREGGQAHGRPLYLACYHGSPFVVDRIIRGTQLLEKPVVAILGGIQPGPWRALVRNAANALSSDHDGLLQRLTPVILEPLPWEGERPRIAAEQQAAYDNLLLRCCEQLREDHQMRFAPAAIPVWQDYCGTIQQRLRDPATEEALKGLLAKRQGLVCRLAGILATAWGEREISEQRLIAAITLAQVLEAHAVRAWELGEQAGDPAYALRLARHLLEHRPERFTSRDVYKGRWGGIRTRAAALQALRQLEELNWLRVAERQRRGRGERVIWELSPFIGPQLLPETQTEEKTKTKSKTVDPMDPIRQTPAWGAERNGEQSQTPNWTQWTQSKCPPSGRCGGEADQKAGRGEVDDAYVEWLAAQPCPLLRSGEGSDPDDG